MSDSVWPHRRQTTRLPHPWDSPGKNTGVGCHFLLQCMKVKSESEVSQSCPTLRDPMDCSLPGFSVHGIFQARVLEWVVIAFSAMDPSEYQIVRTHKVNHLNTRPGITQTSIAPCATNKTKIQIQSSADRITTSLSLARQRKKKQKSSAEISPYSKLTETTRPTLGGQKPKGRKNSTMKS